MHPAAGFRLTDSIEFRDDVSGHMLAVLHKSESLIDTVEVAFGVHEFGTDSILYRAISGYRVEDGETWAAVGPVTLYTSGTRTALDERLSGFGPFSSPAVIDDNIYYWSIEPQPLADATQRLWARRYDVRTGATDSLLLGNWIVPPSDDPSLLPSPARLGAEALFHLDSTHVWKWALARRY